MSWSLFHFYQCCVADRHVSDHSSAIAELLMARHATALEQIGILLHFETSPFTQNNHYLADVTAKTLARYKDIREGKVQSSTSRPTGLPPPHGKALDSNGDREGEPSQPCVAYSPIDSFCLAGNPFANFVAGPIRFLPHPLVASTPVADKVDFELSQNTVKTDAARSSPRVSKKRREKLSARRGNVAPAVDDKWVHTEESAEEETPDEPASAPSPSIWTTKPPAPEPSVTASASGFLGGPFPGFTGFNSQPVGSATSSERSQLEADALSALAKLGYVGLTVEDLGKLNPPDEYEEELNVMAEVRAYFQVAYKVCGACPACDAAVYQDLCSESLIIYHSPSTICSCSLLGRLCRRT